MQAAAIASIDGLLLLGPLRHRGQQYNLQVADALSIAPLRSVDRKTDPQIGYFLVYATELIDALLSCSHPKTAQLLAICKALTDILMRYWMTSRCLVQRPPSG
ncbi:MAG: hypothetical protein DME59_00495 [Verrucomicrobia bacterium]|nr:MAG: hypothetical protein DME59_00495 [Verrucomicrobiota bacterium]